MRAFWKYDQFPYRLRGPVDGVELNGLVKPRNYGGSLFKPVIILPEVQGELIQQKLDDLKAEYTDELRAIKAEYMSRAEAIAPMLYPREGGK